MNKILRLVTKKHLFINTPHVISNCDGFIKPNLLHSYKYSDGNTRDYINESGNHANNSLS